MRVILHLPAGRDSSPTLEEEDKVRLYLHICTACCHCECTRVAIYMDPRVREDDMLEWIATSEYLLAMTSYEGERESVVMMGIFSYIRVRGKSYED